MGPDGMVGVTLLIDTDIRIRFTDVNTRRKYLRHVYRQGGDGHHEAHAVTDHDAFAVDRLAAPRE